MNSEHKTNQGTIVDTLFDSSNEMMKQMVREMFNFSK